MKNNGATLWAVDPDNDAIVRALCLTNIDLGEATRVKDDEVCLEEADGVTSLAGDEIENSDSTMEGNYDDTADKAIFNKWLATGRPPVAGEPFHNRFLTQICVAFPNGVAFPVDVWVYKTKLIALQRSQKTRMRVTFATNSNWNDGKANWNDAASFDAKFSAFQAPIAAYYAALANGVGIASATAKAASTSGKFSASKFDPPKK